MSCLSVTSEIAELKTVLLHRPGEELLHLTPSNLSSLLFDDIPHLRVAQEEHDAFASVLKQNGVEVVYLEDLMAETLLQNKNLRKPFIEQFVKEVGTLTEKYQTLLYDFFDSFLDEKTLVKKMIAGVTFQELPAHKTTSLTDYIYTNGSSLIANPLPNLYFTRDPFVVVGNGVVLNRMQSDTRRRETIFADYIFRHHSKYKNNVQFFYTRNEEFHIEGGDIINLTKHAIAVGVSQRTQAAAVEQLAKHIFFESNSSIETIYAFNIPVSRACMHLDTVFTQASKNKFVVHPGMLKHLQIFKLFKQNDKLKVEQLNDSLQKVLSDVFQTNVSLIECGAGNAVHAEREQWNDGSNTLCLREGVVIVYDRNYITNEALKQNGLHVIEIPSAELSRGRGGPHCMSMPLIRE